MRPTIFLAPLLALAWIGYFPGLAGPFLFDDLGTLPEIGRYGGVDNLQTLLLYLAGNDTGVAGRPLSLLSFLLNTSTWPADPWAFKVTNLIIHLAVGSVLYLLARRLLRPLGEGDTAGWIALLVTAYWLLNPLNVSTVLYVVQRMAMLSALFVLLGMLAYVHGRHQLEARPLRAYGWMTAAVVLFTPLAVLSKENGALLPVLILVAEYSLLRQAVAGAGHGEAKAFRNHIRSDRVFRWWVAVFLWLPSLVLVAALYHYSAPPAFAGRDFDLAERLLTEPRILFEYLWYWLNPFADPRGVLVDGYPISRGLLDPWTTLPAVAGVLGLLGWAVWWRRRYPLAAMAILFFFAGHLMESTVLPLELYFEHRNYLPSAFLILPVAAWVVHNPEQHRVLLPLVAVVLLAQGSQTHRLAKTWGDELELAVHWSQQNPQSSRARDFLATTLTKYGRSDLAVAVLEEAIRDRPKNSHFYLHHLVEKCTAASVSPDDWERLRSQVARHPLGVESYPLVAELVSRIPDPNCKGVRIADLQAVLDVMIVHPSSKRKVLWQLLNMKGFLMVKSGQPDSAIEAFRHSLNLHADTGVGMRQVAMLATHGYYKNARDWLETVEKLPRDGGWRDRLRSLDYDGEIQRIRKNLEADLQRARRNM